MGGSRTEEGNIVESVYVRLDRDVVHTHDEADNPNMHMQEISRGFSKQKARAGAKAVVARKRAQGTAPDRPFRSFPTVAVS